MALLFMDGVSHLTATDIGNLKWTSTGGSAAWTIVAGGRYGGSILRNVFFDTGGAQQHHGYIRKLLASNVSTLIASFAFKTNAVNSGSQLQSFMDVTGNTNTSLGLDSSNNWFLNNYAGTRLATGTTQTVALNTWYWVELKITFSIATAGVYELRVNGVTVFSGSGVRTAQATNGGGVLVLGDFTNAGNSFGSTWDYCDVILMDTSGAALNDFTGDRHVATLYATGAGAHTAWTPLSGANYTQVNEAQADTTTYVSDSTVNDIDSYTFTQLGASVITVDALQFNLYAQKTSAGLRKIAPFQRNAATTEAVGTTTPDLSASWLLYSDIHQTSLVSGIAWTPSEVNGSQFGEKVIT